jgi:hypothetical protein
MPAQRAEESSRQSLQIMQPAGLNHSSQRTRNHSGTGAASAETRAKRFYAVEQAQL